MVLDGDVHSTHLRPRESYSDGIDFRIGLIQADREQRR